MTSFTRSCLHKSMRIVNLIVLPFAIGMIIYSLWLQKKWNEGRAELPDGLSLPKPWFICACLGVGIAACFSSLCGHMMDNCISNLSVFIYILGICCLAAIEVNVIVTVFFKMDWRMQIDAYVDKYHEDFKNFVIFNEKLCRYISLFMLVVQVNVVVLSFVLWAVGIDPRVLCNGSNNSTPDFTQSFLVPISPGADISTLVCRRCGNLHSENPPRSLFSYVISMLRVRFQRENILL